MDLLQLYRDFSVNHATEGHKHCSPGWVNTECPFCTGNPGLHLGFELQDNYYFCYRCGWHPIISTIAKLLNVSEGKAKEIIKNYGILIPKVSKEPLTKIRSKAYRQPSGVMPLQANHKKYLLKRGFDPDEIEQVWGVKGTGPISLLDDINFKHRLIIPIPWDEKEVSFTSRDITNKSALRYITCPKDRELVNHKTIIYGKQKAWKETGVLVEGPTDAWRLGTSSFAVFGIKYTPAQLRRIANLFKRVYVCFDDEPQAIIQANKIVAELKFRNVKAERIPIVGDPGSMKQEDANYLMKQLMK